MRAELSTCHMTRQRVPFKCNPGVSRLWERGAQVCRRYLKSEPGVRCARMCLLIFIHRRVTRFRVCVGWQSLSEWGWYKGGYSGGVSGNKSTTVNNRWRFNGQFFRWGLCFGIKGNCHQVETGFKTSGY